MIGDTETLETISANDMQFQAPRIRLPYVWDWLAQTALVLGIVAVTMEIGVITTVLVGLAVATMMTFWSKDKENQN